MPEPAEPDHEWVPSPEPSPASLLAKDAEGVLSAPLRLARRIEQAVEHPDATLRQVSESLSALGEVGWNFANPAPEVPLNVEIGSHRRFAWVRSDLAKFKRLKDVLGSTGTTSSAVSPARGSGPRGA